MAPNEALTALRHSVAGRSGGFPLRLHPFAQKSATMEFHATANLYRLFVLRNIAILAQGSALCAAIFGLNMALPFPPMVVVIVLTALLNLFVWLRIRVSGNHWPVSDGELFVQLLLDVMALSVLLFYSGGATNPFVSVYLLPLAIAAAILPRHYAWLMAGLSITGYTLLMFYYVALPPVNSHWFNDFSLHIFGMWLTFVFSALLMAFFLVQMVRALRQRDAKLAKARESVLRSEQIVALGTLAAGAAHELGTPLSTLAVVIHELEQDLPRHPQLADDLAAMRQQITRCKHILAQMVSKASDVTLANQPSLNAKAWLDQILDDWQLMRPTVQPQVSWKSIQNAPCVRADQTLQQAILNLLNNAADASPETVELEISWDDSILHVRILDRGAGLTADAITRAGTPFFTTKKGRGLGLGLFLANATIERFGGSVQLTNRDGGGAITRIELPLSEIQGSEN